MSKVFNILVLCTGNSARSILGEMLFKHLGKGRIKAWSAGSKPGGQVNPVALETLAKHGIPVADARSKSWDEFAVPSAPANAVARAVTPEDVQTAAPDAAVDGTGDEAQEAGAAAGRARGQGRSRVGKGAAAGDKAAAPRARSAKSSKSAGGADATAGAVPPAAAEAASPTEAEATVKAPARPRSRARKPADKSAE